MCDHLSRLTAKQFPSIIPFAYLWSKSFVVGYLIFLITNDLFKRIPYSLNGSFNPYVTTNKELHIRAMEIQRCQRMLFLKSRLLYAGFTASIMIKQNHQWVPTLGGEKLRAVCLLMSTESENLSKGVRNWKEGGGGGVGNLIPSIEIPFYFKSHTKWLSLVRRSLNHHESYPAGVRRKTASLRPTSSVEDAISLQHLL